VSNQTVDQLEEKKQQGVVDYLQAPRKKRKNYVVFAVGESFHKDTAASMEIFVRKNFPAMAIAAPKNIQDLKRLFTREISLLVIDDHFSSLDDTLDVVAYFKEKKNATLSPVLFLTEDPSRLITSYQKRLMIHQEVDNYIPYRNLPLAQIYARIQHGLNIKEARRSRRFSIVVPVKYLLLSRNKFFDGQLIDISIHGAVLKSSLEEGFKVSDQLKLHLPSFGILPNQNGEFLRLSAKVRRLFLSGDKCGISWEYISDEQHFLLTKYVTELVNRDMYLKARKNDP
jgi:hypothetical protein